MNFFSQKIDISPFFFANPLLFVPNTRYKEVKKKKIISKKMYKSYPESPVPVQAQSVGAGAGADIGTSVPVTGTFE